MVCLDCHASVSRVALKRICNNVYWDPVTALAPFVAISVSSHCFSSWLSPSCSSLLVLGRATLLWTKRVVDSVSWPHGLLTTVDWVICLLRMRVGSLSQWVLSSESELIELSCTRLWRLAVPWPCHMSTDFFLAAVYRSDQYRRSFLLHGRNIPIVLVHMFDVLYITAYP